MKVTELLEKIDNEEFDLEKELEVKEYLPIELKKTIAQGIIYECTSEEGGALAVDSVQQYLSYIKYMITMHTNLEYTDDDYDTLCSTEYNGNTLLNTIIGYFADDSKECTRILKLMTGDYTQNYSIEATLSKFLYQLKDVLSDVASTINDKLNDISLESLVDEKDMTSFKNFFERHKF